MMSSNRSAPIRNEKAVGGDTAVVAVKAVTAETADDTAGDTVCRSRMAWLSKHRAKATSRNIRGWLLEWMIRCDPCEENARCEMASYGFDDDNDDDTPRFR